MAPPEPTSSAGAHPPELGSDTGIFERQFRRRLPALAWLRQNFTLPAVVTIAGLVAGGSAWLWNQHEAIKELQRRPDLGPQLAGLAARLDQDERNLLAGRYEERIAKMEGYWEDAGKIARERVRRH